MTKPIAATVQLTGHGLFCMLLHRHLEMEALYIAYQSGTNQMAKRKDLFVIDRWIGEEERAASQDFQGFLVNLLIDEKDVGSLELTMSHLELLH